VIGRGFCLGLLFGTYNFCFLFSIGRCARWVFFGFVSVFLLGLDFFFVLGGTCFVWSKFFLFCIAGVHKVFLLFLTLMERGINLFWWELCLEERRSRGLGFFGTGFCRVYWKNR